MLIEHVEFDDTDIHMWVWLLTILCVLFLFCLHTHVRVFRKTDNGVVLVRMIYWIFNELIKTNFHIIIYLHLKLC